MQTYGRDPELLFTPPGGLLTLSNFVQSGAEFIQAHLSWSLQLVFLLAFLESLVLISLLVPATMILVVLGVLLGRSGLALWPFWLVAVLGAFLGEWLSYWLGGRFSYRVTNFWIFRRYPNLVMRGIRFFRRWGVIGVFMGRFFAPLRSTVPLAAGVCHLPFCPFQLANFTSAVVWASLILAPGTIWGDWLSRWFPGTK